MSADVTIRGGTVVSGGGVQRADVTIEEGRIVDVGSSPVAARRVIDASGLWVLPGMVDTHVHLMDPGETQREDFPTGTAAAAARGVTTIVEHTHAHPIRAVADLEVKLAQLVGRSNVDFGLAAHVWPDRISELASLWEAGVTFFKIFTCTTHGVPGLSAALVEEAFTAVAAFDGVALVHCEDESMTERAEALLRSSGRDDFGIVLDWRTRPAELVATGVVALLASLTGVRATVAHVSHPEVAEVITHARGLGADLAAEACPQYFALREEEVLAEGPLRKFTPPARARSDADEAEMWGLLRRGVLSHLSTDHAPSTRAQKASGSIWDAPFGLPGLDTTAPFILDAAVRGVVRPEDAVRVYAEAPAVRYGLARKGRLAPGGDGDVALFDPEGTWKVSDEAVISKAGWSPFSGRTFRGRVIRTLLRGIDVAVDGEPVDGRGGAFLPGPGATGVT